MSNINLNLEDQTLSKSNNSSSSININTLFAANTSSNTGLQNNVDNFLVTINSDLSIDQTLIEVNENLSSTKQNLDKFSTLNVPHETSSSNDLTNNVKKICTTQISVPSNSKEETLKNILLYPEVKSSKKNNKKKIQLPSVITSDRWLEIRKTENDKKRLLLEQKQKKKAELLIKREENLKVKAEKKEKREMEKKKKQQEKERKKEETIAKKLRTANKTRKF